MSEGDGSAFVFGGESRVLDGEDDEGSDDNGQANALSVVFPPDDEVAAAAIIPALDRETVAQNDGETDSCDICGSSSDDDADSDRGAWSLGDSGETWKLGDISRADKYEFSAADHGLSAVKHGQTKHVSSAAEHGFSAVIYDQAVRQGSAAKHRSAVWYGRLAV